MALSKSRRRAREGALQALFQIEIGKANLTDAIETTVMDTGLSHDLADYMDRLVRGVYTNRRELDPYLEDYLKDYDLDRLAAVDRNVLRIATYELLHVPEMPPAVTINEAIEISRKFSTAESGKFVNGVLGRMVRNTPKANWNPADAPPEAEEEAFVPEPEPVVEEEVVQEGTQEAKDAKRFGWVLKSGDRDVPPTTE
ncbi:MAG: transcription antitermination factor NusB [Fimbriimonas sp.]